MTPIIIIILLIFKKKMNQCTYICILLQKTKTIKLIWWQSTVTQTETLICWTFLLRGKLALCIHSCTQSGFNTFCKRVILQLQKNRWCGRKANKKKIKSVKTGEWRRKRLIIALQAKKSIRQHSYSKLNKCFQNAIIMYKSHRSRSF